MSRVRSQGDIRDSLPQPESNIAHAIPRYTQHGIFKHTTLTLNANYSNVSSHTVQKLIIIIMIMHRLQHILQHIQDTDYSTYFNTSRTQAHLCNPIMQLSTQCKHITMHQ